jgi:hypothetical protein
VTPVRGSISRRWEPASAEIPPRTRRVGESGRDTTSANGPGMDRPARMSIGAEENDCPSTVRTIPAPSALPEKRRSPRYTPCSNGTGNGCGASAATAVPTSSSAAPTTLVRGVAWYRSVSRRVTGTAASPNTAAGISNRAPLTSTSSSSSSSSTHGPSTSPSRGHSRARTVPPRDVSSETRTPNPASRVPAAIRTGSGTVRRGLSVVQVSVTSWSLATASTTRPLAGMPSTRADPSSTTNPGSSSSRTRRDCSAAGQEAVVALRLAVREARFTRSSSSRRSGKRTAWRPAGMTTVGGTPSGGSADRTTSTSCPTGSGRNTRAPEGWKPLDSRTGSGAHRNTWPDSSSSFTRLARGRFEPPPPPALSVIRARPSGRSSSRLRIGNDAAVAPAGDPDGVGNGKTPRDCRGAGRP